ncbi:TDP-N-acetylfucosamine:lipid II N-acetylfucosaminyltransferase [Vibrio cincinnatiensis]
MKLLHIIQDEKFPDAAYRQFETILPDSNDYIYPNKNKKIKYLKLIQPNRVSRFAYLRKEFIKSLNKYDAVILHSMTLFALEVIARADENVKFVWIGMGFDYYDLINDSHEDLYFDLTKELVRECHKNKYDFSLKRLLKSIAFPFLYPNIYKKSNLINKVDIFCPVIRHEHELIKIKHPNFRPKIVEWNYGSQVEIFDKHEDFKLNVKRTDILVGNSASPNNNHLEIFELLAKVKLDSNTKVIVPLSYGDELYKNKIIEKGVKFFGERFLPITEFMSIWKYSQLLNRCDIMIMNHKRQQAAGNIALGLLMGTKVFLNENNPLVKFYQKYGIETFSIKNIGDEINTPLSFEIKEKNRKILLEKKSIEAHLENTRNLIEEINKLGGKTV